MGLTHGSNLRDSPRWDLRGVVDFDKGVAQAAAHGLGAEVRAFASVDDAAADDAPSPLAAAIICTSTPSHASAIKAAADAGLHVFVEKPVCVDAGDIEECYDYCAKRGVALFAGFHRRFDPVWRAFHARVTDPAWGPCEVLHVFGRDAPCPPVSFLQTSGGIFHDLMVHHIDQARWVMGPGARVVEVMAMTHTWTPALADADPPVLEETAGAMLRFDTGGIALVDNSRRGPQYDERMFAFSRAGFLRCGHDPLDPLSAAFNDTFSTRFADAYRLEMDHFADVLQRGVPMEVTREDSVANSRVAEALTQAARTGSGVAV